MKSIRVNVCGYLHLTRRSGSRLGVNSICHHHHYHHHRNSSTRLSQFVREAVKKTAIRTTILIAIRIKATICILDNQYLHLVWPVYSPHQDCTSASIHFLTIRLAHHSLSFCFILLIELGMPCAVNPKLLHHATRPRTCMLKCQSGTVGV